jgi:sugar phosphate isomerase/epimerase
MVEMETSATFTLSAFGDEIADDLHEQLQVMRELHIGFLDLRSVWGKNVLHLDDDQISEVGRICAEHGIAVSCIGSPVGKSPIANPIETEMSNLAHLFRVAEALGTRRVRIFSFFPPARHNNLNYDNYLQEAISRLAQLTKMAQREGFQLVLENERDIVGDTVERCHAILSAIDNPHLRFLWDPGNFILVGEAEPTERGWPLLGQYTAYVHIKDAVLADSAIRPAGEGDGQVGKLLAHLRDSGYQGYLALEPHLATAGHSGGFSGASGMALAAETLRQLMMSHGCPER